MSEETFFLIGGFYYRKKMISLDFLLYFNFFSLAL